MNPIQNRTFVQVMNLSLEWIAEISCRNLVVDWVVLPLRTCFTRNPVILCTIPRRPNGSFIFFNPVGPLKSIFLTTNHKPEGKKPARNSRFRPKRAKTDWNVWKSGKPAPGRFAFCVLSTRTEWTMDQRTFAQYRKSSG